MLRSYILKLIFGRVGEFLWPAARELSHPTRKNLMDIAYSIVRETERYNVDLGDDRRRIAENIIRMEIQQLGLPIDPSSHLVNLAIELAVTRMRNP